MNTLGKYQILEQLGTGGMGIVYRARDTVLERDVALKTIRTETTVAPELKERFYREARACARLQHPNIVAVYDLGEWEAIAYIAMELLEGADLRRIIDARQFFPLETKLEMMTQVCEALAHAHGHGIVHRDIKPGNLFVHQGCWAKILDFGVARVTASKLTRAGAALGTPDYMAPEQIAGRACDGRADLFSAAMVFYEFLVYVHPFRAPFIARRIVHEDPDPLCVADPLLPDSLEQVLFKGLAKNPDERYQTGGEFASALRQVRAEVGQMASKLAGEAGQLRDSLLSGRAELAGFLECRKVLEAFSKAGGDYTLLDRWPAQPPGYLEISGLLARLQELARVHESILSWTRESLETLDHARSMLQRGDLAGCRQILEMMEAYLPEHPRVQALREELAAAEQRRTRLLELAELKKQMQRALDTGDLEECLRLVPLLSALPLPDTETQNLLMLASRALAAAEAPQQTPRPQILAPVPRPEDPAEQRLAEFLRLLHEFDEAMEEKDTAAAHPRLERMEKLAAVDDRFRVATEQGRKRLEEIEPTERGAPLAAPPAAGSPPVLPLELPVFAAARRGARPAEPPVAKPPAEADFFEKTTEVAPDVRLDATVLFSGAQPESGWPVPPTPAPPPVRPPARLGEAAPTATVALRTLVLGLLTKMTKRHPRIVARVGLAVLVVTAAIGYILLRPLPVLPAVAEAAVSRAGARVMASRSAGAKPVTPPLRAGDRIGILEAPTSGERDWVHVQFRGKRPFPPGYMKTADLTEFGRWKTDRPETAFALLRLSRPPEGAGEAELRGRLEELGAFLGRFSLSSQAAEANLESAEIKLTLAQMAQAAGQSSEKCQSHLQAAAAQLKEAAVDPRLAAEAGVTQERLGTLQKACAPEPAKPAPTPGLSREERLRSAEQLYERGDNKEALERLKRLLREYPDSKAAKVLREKVETSLELMGR